MEQLTEHELQGRRDDVETSLGSMALEGMHPDPITLGILEDFATGRIDEDDLDRAVKQLADQHRRIADEARRAA